jgi:peroxiredoxin
MRSGPLPLVGLAFVACVAAASGDDPPAPQRARIDAPAPEFRLRDVMSDEQRVVALSELRGKVVVLFFLSDKCQVTWLYEERTGKLIQDLRGDDVVFLGVRSSAGDSEAEIRAYAEAKNFDIPILFDEDNHLADAFDVAVTPLFAVIDREGVLRYFGGFDDNQNRARMNQPAESATRQYVREAIGAVVAGRAVTTKEAPGYG